MKAFTQALVMLGAVAALIGCGGGGGGSTPGGGSAGNARVGIFVTDNLTLDYDHVWVTIKKVELDGQAGKVAVYDDAAGRTVDLRALNDAGTQKFALLGEATVPAGTYSQVEITVDQALSLVPTGSTTAQDKTFAGSANGTKKLTFNLTQGTVSGTQDIVADFDLSQWTVDGALVNAVVVEGNDDNVGGNQEAFEFAGSISGLSGVAPNLTFDLVQGPWALKVVTSQSTTIFNNDGSPNPTLANGGRVQVKGTFDTTTRTLTATDIKIKLVNEAVGEAEVEGLASSIGTDTFDLSTMKVKGFVPSSTSVHVTVGANTRYFTDRGIAITKEEFFAALATAGAAEAEGIYNETSNTIAATKVKIEAEAEDEENESEIDGTVTSFDAAAGTFQVTVRSWEGTNIQVGAVVTVVTNAGTEYKKSSKTAFWASLANGAEVEVKGSLNGTTLTAERVKSESEDDGGHGGGGGDDDNGGHGGDDN